MLACLCPNPDTRVAPRTGAWIEIGRIAGTIRLKRVAPRTGAWIEIGLDSILKKIEFVAPRTGAWIEMKLEETEAANG